ncbi:hypothetical protein [Arsenophonus sp. PmNCSU2021_1]|uniref:hypothetical protein n=1 Tax=Arsenophonus sp. PmNCSU2021_1 TaxID=3118989 RepID=UPI002FF0D642
MRFIAFIITIVILETLFLFYFKQASSMIAMSVINLSAVFCFFSKNWRESEKVFKYPLLVGFFIGNILILSREFLEISAKNDGYVFSEVIYGGIILSAIISLFIAGAILFSYAPQDWQRNGYSDHSSHNFSPFNSEHANSNLFDEEISDRLDTNPATGLSMSGCGSDCAGNMYGSGSYDIGGSLSSYSFDSSYDDSSHTSYNHYDNDFSTTSGFDHNDHFSDSHRDI